MVIILIGEVNVQNKRELTKIENEYIQMELNNVLCMNTIGAYRTEEEKLKILRRKQIRSQRAK